MNSHLALTRYMLNVYKVKHNKWKFLFLFLYSNAKKDLHSKAVVELYEYGHLVQSKSSIRMIPLRSVLNLAQTDPVEKSKIRDI